MKSPTVAEITPAVGVGASPKGADIGRFPPQYAVGTIAQRLRLRLRYVTRAAYYVAIHRSFQYWRWCLSAEGIEWN